MFQGEVSRCLAGPVCVQGFQLPLNLQRIHFMEFFSYALLHLYSYWKRSDSYTQHIVTKPLQQPASHIRLQNYYFFDGEAKQERKKNRGRRKARKEPAWQMGIMTLCSASTYENSRQGISLIQKPKEIVQEIVHNLTQQISWSPFIT